MLVSSNYAVRGVYTVYSAGRQQNNKNVSFTSTISDREDKAFKKYEDALDLVGKQNWDAQKIEQNLSDVRNRFMKKSIKDLKDIKGKKFL